MAAAADFGNMALQMLGASSIVSLNDDSDNARALTIAYNMVRDRELRVHRWKFSILRANLPALSTAPVNGIYGAAFQLPPDNIRVLNVGDWDPGTDRSDYRYRTTAEYSIENGKILTSIAAPLSLRYVSNAIPEGQWDPAFGFAFSARLAWQCCEKITQSVEKRKLAMQEYAQAIKDAIRANSLESPPVYNDDDSWMTARIEN